LDYLGTKIAIIIGATITGLLLLGLMFCLIFFVCRKKPGKAIQFNYPIQLYFFVLASKR
jgi:hypothetical protein